MNLIFDRARELAPRNPGAGIRIEHSRQEREDPLENPADLITDRTPPFQAGGGS